MRPPKATRSTDASGRAGERSCHAVQLLGRPTISGVDCGDRQLTADLVVSAVGDVPNTDWLAGSSPVEAHDRPVAAAAVNHRMPIVKLK